MKEKFSSVFDSATLIRVEGCRLKFMHGVFVDHWLTSSIGKIGFSLPLSAIEVRDNEDYALKGYTSHSPCFAKQIEEITLSKREIISLYLNLTCLDDILAGGELNLDRFSSPETDEGLMEELADTSIVRMIQNTLNEKKFDGLERDHRKIFNRPGFIY